MARPLDARVLLISKELEEARRLAKKQITAHRRPRTAVARQRDNGLGVAGSIWIDRNTVMGALTPRKALAAELLPLSAIGGIIDGRTEHREDQ